MYLERGAECSFHLRSECLWEKEELLVLELRLLWMWACRSQWLSLSSLFHLEGQRGFPFPLSRPSAGAGGQQGSIAVPAVYMVQFHLSQWLPWTCFVSASSQAVRWMMRFTSNKILGGGSLQECISQALAPRSELWPPCQVPADTEDRFPVRSPTCHEPSFSSRQLPPSLSQRGCLICKCENNKVINKN